MSEQLDTAKDDIPAGPTSERGATDYSESREPSQFYLRRQGHELPPSDVANQGDMLGTRDRVKDSLDGGSVQD